MLELALNPAFAVSSIAFVVAVRVNPGGGMRHMKTDYKIDRTPYVPPLGSRAGPTAVALGGALPASVENPDYVRSWQTTETDTREAAE